MISQDEASFAGGALESVLASAAERPPSEDSPLTDTRVCLVGLRRRFTESLPQNETINAEHAKHAENNVGSVRL